LSSLGSKNFRELCEELLVTIPSKEWTGQLLLRCREAAVLKGSSRLLSALSQMVEFADFSVPTEEDEKESEKKANEWAGILLEDLKKSRNHALSLELTSAQLAAASVKFPAHIDVGVGTSPLVGVERGIPEGSARGSVRSTTSTRIEQQLHMAQAVSDMLAGLDISSLEIVEREMSPEDVEHLWDAIYKRFSVVESSDRRALRVGFIIFCIHNGTSDKLTSRRNLVLNSVSVSIQSLIRFVQVRTTLRRFMRGQAVMARQILRERPEIDPAWRRRHLPAVDREIGFDFADALPDISDEERRMITEARDRALSRTVRR